MYKHKKRCDFNTQTPNVHKAELFNQTQSLSSQVYKVTREGTSKEK